MSDYSQKTTTEVLRPLLSDFVAGRLEDDALRSEIKNRLKDDKDLAMAYAKEVREALDEGRIEAPEFPERPLPDIVQRVLSDPSDVPATKTSAKERILSALERAKKSGNHAIANLEKRLERWINVANTGGFQLVPAAVPNRRGGNVRVRFEHLSDCGMMAIVDLSDSQSSISVVVKPVYLEKFMVVVVSLESDGPPIFQEITESSVKAEFEFTELSKGSYVVTIEPSQ